MTHFVWYLEKEKRYEIETFSIERVLNNLKKLYGPFLWMGFNCLKATATSRRQFTFYHSVPRNSWYSFYRPRKDKRLSRPWSHPVVLSTGPLDWESRSNIFMEKLSRKCEPKASPRSLFNFGIYLKTVIECKKLL